LHSIKFTHVIGFTFGTYFDQDFPENIHTVYIHTTAFKKAITISLIYKLGLISQNIAYSRNILIF